MPYPYQEPDAVFRMSYIVQGFKKKARYIFSIILKETGEFIGEVSLHLNSNNPQQAETGYWVGEPYWGRGIATEAVGAILKFGFEKLQLELIFGTCHVENVASQRVLLRHAMKADNPNRKVILYHLDCQAYESHVSGK